MTFLQVTLFALLMVLCYFIGLNRGNNNHKNDYDKGYNDALNEMSCEECYQAGFHDALKSFETEEKKEPDKAEILDGLIVQLDELFGPEEEPE